jgi:D-glycero-D-manno-heptose 1,7-bisphosphate phosphatase
LEIHQKMQDSIEAVGGRLDAMYFCPNLKEENPLCRKPDIGMALQAQNDFPEINFSKSIVVGDSFSDMGFAEKLGAVPVFIYNETPILENDVKLTWSYHTNLLHFASYIQPLVKR